MAAKEKFADLKAEIIKYATLVEEMVDKSITSFLEKNTSLAESVVEYDERQADIWENKLDEACISFIALYQPEAKVLRFSMMIYKMASDLERIADIATNIAKDACSFCEYAVNYPMEQYEKMKKLSLQMLRQAIEAFVQEDAVKAMEVIQADRDVNSLRDTINRDLIEHMNKKEDNVLPWIIMLSVSRHIEKIADITTNIAEEVVYITEGRVIKHHHL
ncbi:MAG: phosphate signaling complex protein PhoU [Brevinematales bacterium]|nr:phosphate signaling complex protein PhoU [Brevinematales bacterium]